MKAVRATGNTCLLFTTGGFYLSTNWSVCFGVCALDFHQFVRLQCLHQNTKSQTVVT